MPFSHRRKLFVDPQVQGALLFRVFLYWLLCVGLMSTMLACWRTFTGPEVTLPELFGELWFQYSPALVASLLVLPLVLFDTVRVSNRFVGPIYRLRQRMRELAAGGRAHPIKFRDGDFWLEMADEFNAVLNQLPAARERQNMPREQGSETSDKPSTCVENRVEALLRKGS